MTCPIFTATSVASRTYSEVSRLSAALQDIVLQSYDLEEGEDLSDEDELGWLTRSYSVELLLRGVVPRRRLPSQLIFRFDMFRDIPAIPSWPHASEALLIVAYAPIQDSGWNLDELSIDASGCFPEHKENLVSQLDGRILQWDDDYGDTPWNRRDWIFGVPLKNLTGLDAVRKEVTGPLLTLLSGGSPEQAFADAIPATWSQAA
jgi:hypothetical protein